jgi:hypothetical protein
MLKLESEFKELEKIGIIKNLQIDYINEQFIFEFCVPKENIMECIERYLYETYGLIIKKTAS